MKPHCNRLRSAIVLSLLGFAVAACTETRDDAQSSYTIPADESSVPSRDPIGPEIDEPSDDSENWANLSSDNLYADEGVAGGGRFQVTIGDSSYVAVGLTPGRRGCFVNGEDDFLATYEFPPGAQDGRGIFSDDLSPAGGVGVRIRPEDQHVIVAFYEPGGGYSDIFSGVPSMHWYSELTSLEVTSGHVIGTASFHGSPNDGFPNVEGSFEIRCEPEG